MKTFQKMKATHAKNRFGELLDNAQAGPVMIEKNGRDVAVLLSKAEYDRLLGGGSIPQEIKPADISSADQATPETNKNSPPKPSKNNKVAKPKPPKTDEVESKQTTTTTAAKANEQNLDETEVDIHALVQTSLVRHNERWAGLYQALAGDQ